MAKQYLVELVQGQTHVTPWGQVSHRGRRFSETDEGRIRYFRENGRFQITDAGETSKASPVVAPSARPIPVGRTKAVPLTDARILALAKATVSITQSKPALLSLAKDLGVKEADSKGKPILVKLIKERQAAILAEQSESEEQEEQEDEGEAESE